MDDLFYLILFFVFVLAPLLEKLRGKGRVGTPLPPDQRRRTPTRDADEGWQAGGQPTGVSADDGTREAHSVIPDDLWELLTGERRSERRPVPIEESEPAAYAEAEDVEVVSAEDVGWEEAGSLEDVEPIRRERIEETTRVPAREAPEWLYAEPERSPAERLAALRAEPVAVSRLATSKPLETEVLGRRPARLGRLWLKDMDELRRAVVLMEILKRPRGLE